MTVILGSPARLAGAVAVCCLFGSRATLAFPEVDLSAPGASAGAPAVSESDLRHQLQLHTGGLVGLGEPAAGGGWTFLPSLGLQEAYTDNILNSGTDRRWDFITIFTPGIAIRGDLPNMQVNLNYAPQVRVNARTSSQNNVTQNLAATGNFTLIPDALYLNARAFAGIAPTGGGFGALGLGGAPTFGSPLSGLGAIGLSKQNQVQTSSLSIAPYFVHRFDDTGTFTIGYQFSQSAFAQGDGYIPLFFPTGSDAVHTTTNEGIVQFETGERFAPFRNLILADARLGDGNGASRNSTQYTISNRLGYLVNRSITVYGEFGYESLHFNGTPPTRIDGPTWGIGTTFTPNPDSTITIGFGHKYGDDNFLLNGSYALTARTRISASYTTGLQTDLQALQGQLDLFSLDSLGRAVDASTGGPLFLGTGGLGIQSGLFRTKALTVSANTVLDRDQFSVSVQFNESTTIATAPPGTFIPIGVPAPPVGSTSTATTVFFNWVHQLSEPMALYTSASYGTSHVSTGGDQQSVATSIALQYAISDTLTAQARYSFFDRISSTPGQGFYQNLVLIGISKQF